MEYKAPENISVKVKSCPTGALDLGRECLPRAPVKVLTMPRGPRDEPTSS